MGETKVSERQARAAWPTALMVVAVVAAASVALGLTVVGPMIQRNREAPPPTLVVSSPAPAPPVETARAEAEVQIKERVIPRPKPKPPAELVVPLTVNGQDPNTPGGANGAPGEPGQAATRPATGENDRAGRSDRRRDSIHGEVTEADEGSDQTADGSRTRDGDSKSRRRRLSPIEALPALGSSLPRTPAADRGADAAAAGTDSSPSAGAADGASGERDGRRSGRSYRVQVGRFADENDARRLRDELAGSGLSPRVVRSEREGVVLYRVQVGTFKMKENADRQVEQLKEKQYEPYIADDDP
jgi:cell division protein FtsN